MNKVHKIFGPPGTGKTTKLLSILEQELSGGTKPYHIGFFSFTRKSANEAKERAMAKFPDLDEEDFYFFRTIHSFAFRNLGNTSGSVMKNHHFKLVGERANLETTGKQITSNDETMWMGVGDGDKAIFLENLSRIRCETLRETWEKNMDDIDWGKLQHFAAVLKKYKEESLMFDFTDMLGKFVELGRVPNLPVIIVDEAQDLSRLQWAVINLLVKQAERVYIAGDDDQAIFRWAGADVDTFIKIPGNEEVLTQSYRIPPTIHKLALFLKKGIKGGVAKSWHPRQGEKEDQGSINFELYRDIPQLEKGTWLCLGRNGYNLKEFEEVCEEAGYPYESPNTMERYKALPAIVTWERLRAGKSVSADKALAVYDMMAAGYGYKKGCKSQLEKAKKTMLTLEELKIHHGLHVDGIWHECLTRIVPHDKEYFVRVLRRGEKITGIPRIRIATIHGAKGGEAEGVFVNPEMSWKNQPNNEEEISDEYRVWYVAATRAKKNLHILHPSGNYYFEPLTSTTKL